MSKNLKKMISYYKPYLGVFWADMFFATVSAAVALVIPLVIRYVTSTLIYMEPQAILGQIRWIALMLFALVAVDCYSRFFIANQGHVMGAKIEYDMRAEIFAHFQKLSFSFYDDQKVGQLMSRITTDLFDITELMHHGPENIILSLIKIIGAFVILMSIKPALALAAFAVLPFMFLFAYYMNGKMRRAFRSNRERIADINAQIEDNLSGIRVVKSFANEDIEKEKFRQGNEGFLRAKKNSYYYMGSFSAGLGTFTTLIQVNVILAGVILIAKGSVDISDLVTFLLYISVFTEPVRTLIDFTEQFQNGYTGFERFQEIMAIEPDIADKEDAKELVNVKGDISFEDVSFQYEENTECVLNHINLNVPAGAYMALVGASGAGKSTLCSLIPRFYDVTGGQITLDGKDIRRISMEELREEIGFVPQKGVLFSGTIASNLRFGKADATDEDIKEAAEIAQATEFIETKKEKYNSPIAQGGSNVSGGQKQRLAIARAIAKKAKVLVFDDSFSALDMKTDAALRKELNEKVQDASIVIVAQRVSTILHADQILVLDDGKIVGKGTHEELLKNCEVYLQIAKSQLSEKELGLEKLGLAEEKAEKETNKKEILSTKIDEKENNKLKKKSDDRKLKHKKGGK